MSEISVGGLGILCGRSGFFNCSLLKEGDIYGEELLAGALDPKAGADLSSSTRTVMALA